MGGNCDNKRDSHESVQTVKFWIRERPHCTSCVTKMNIKLQILKEINENNYRIDKAVKFHPLL